MNVRSSGSQPVRIEQDVVLARQLSRKLAQDCGMRLIDLTKLVTAVSELARNTVVYGGGGDMDWQVIEETGRTGLRLVQPGPHPGTSSCRSSWPCPSEGASDVPLASDRSHFEIGYDWRTL